jgi:lipopolysaccharide transport system ATP-binding protein
MAVRLAFSAATVIRPDVLIVDEALAVGDIYFQQKCFARIQSFRERGTTLLFVSHDPQSVLNLCDRAILLEHGKLLVDDEPKVALDLYQAKVLQRVDPTPSGLTISLGQAPDSGEIRSAMDESEAGSEDPPPTGEAAGSLTSGEVDLRELWLEDEAGHTTQTVLGDTLCVVCMRLRFHRAFAEPHVGFKIRDRFGIVFYETHTHALDQVLPRSRAGEERVLRFSFRALLPNGQYTLTVGVANQGLPGRQLREALLYVHDVAAFTVHRPGGNPGWAGMCNLEAKLHGSESR